jgi:hypothetical protein
LENGNFELVPVTGGVWDTFDYIEGWYVVDAAGKPELQRQGLFGWKAAPGNGRQWLELDGDENGPEHRWNESGDDYRARITGRPERGLYAIHQTVETEPGQTYRVSYDLAARPDVARSESRMQVTISDATGDLVSRTEQANASFKRQPKWETRSFTFVARESVTSLTLRGLGKDNTVGLLLDDVRLVSLSTPSAKPTSTASGAMLIAASPIASAASVRLVPAGERSVLSSAPTTEESISVSPRESVIDALFTRELI